VKGVTKEATKLNAKSKIESDNVVPTLHPLPAFNLKYKTDLTIPLIFRK